MKKNWGFGYCIWKEAASQANTENMNYYYYSLFATQLIGENNEIAYLNSAMSTSREDANV